MTHILNIEVPDEIYQPLQERARAAEQTLDVWVVNRLRAEIEAGTEAGTYDPLERFIGAFSSNETNHDWADNHDQYLAAQWEAEMRAEDNTS